MAVLLYCREKLVNILNKTRLIHLDFCPLPQSACTVNTFVDVNTLSVDFQVVGCFDINKGECRCIEDII